MNKLILGLSLLFLAGCAGLSPDPMPQVPDVKSAEERACVEKCHENYASCVKATQGVWGTQNINVILNDCKAMLGECYGFCVDH